MTTTSSRGAIGNSYDASQFPETVPLPSTQPRDSGRFVVGPAAE